jgi:hypothetical protein
MRRDEAINLLRQRQTARREGNVTLLHKLDRQISAAVAKKEWPEIRADSARPISSPPTSNMTTNGPGTKWEEWSGKYLKAPPPKDWEA